MTQEMKITAIAPSNIAFIKYWGKQDEELKIPLNDSISMNLSNLTTTTTVHFSASYPKDGMTINGKEGGEEGKRALKHVDFIRKTFQKKIPVKIVSQNSFPAGTGLSSSASGFAALTKAVVAALGLQLSEKAVSILARIGSGSAARSIPDGFVRWFAGSGTSDRSYAVSLHPPSFWDLADTVVIVSKRKKEVGSTGGQKLARTSIFMQPRLDSIGDKINRAIGFLEKKDFTRFGELVEKEALEMHAVMLTSNPPLVYLEPETVSLMKEVYAWRKSGLEVYYTLNTGQDIHLLSMKKDVPSLISRLENLDYVQRVITNYPGKGTRITGNHLF